MKDIICNEQDMQLHQLMLENYSEEIPKHNQNPLFTVFETHSGPSLK